jgi:hypothetical protein
MCPHTAIYVSSYCFICVVILLYMCPHTAIHMSSYCYKCVLILLYMCPHTATYVSIQGSVGAAGEGGCGDERVRKEVVK